MSQNNYPNQLPTQFTQQKQDDEIDLKELFLALWKGKWVIVSTTFVFAVAAVIFAISQPNTYKADILLAPAESSGQGGLAKMAGQLGGLAALAGVNLGGAESSQTDLAVQVMKSRQFVDHFIQKHDLLVPIMAAKEWNANTNTLVLDDDIYDASTGKWLREPQGLRGVEPTAQEAYDVFIRNMFSVSQDKESGLYTVSIEYFSPFLAQQWTSWLVRDINKVMRERVIEESTQNLDYLAEQLNKTSIAEMQSAFYQIVEEQTKSLMLAEVQEEFIFKVVDPAVVPELKAGPKRALICVLGTFLGAMLGIVIVLVRFTFRKESVESLEPKP
ncbi:Wzz/FepE/Etk N-terminal domain-containing protein [Vibrio mediterranei]|uniref:Wzz/FepE/Etk N-terminal domain-containing protein n=1 Tax=Vibrio mediterranei TaxID=689 RepID=UPI00148E2577|nr:Wzz/FepE/Etk N-terminal domain-containing protein [Vibrio mediterranei]NOI25396.1 LPS O-antigen length regulator [Vibrio mediterranei]